MGLLEKQATRQEAYDILAKCLGDIRRLPPFKGQTQIATALRRVLNLAVWSKP